MIAGWTSSTASATGGHLGRAGVDREESAGHREERVPERFGVETADLLPPEEAILGVDRYRRIRIVERTPGDRRRSLRSIGEHA